MIASYTVDGLGVRRSGAPAAYTLWIFLLTGTQLLLWASIWRRRELGAYLRGQWLQGLAGGAGTVISALVLKERLTAPRLGCIGLIVAGAWVLRLA